jgi:type I restriction enzyme S subunit
VKVDWVPLGSVLEMNRRPITIEADGSYRRIGIYSWGRGMLRREPASAADMGSMKYFSFPQPSLIFSNIQAWEGAVALAGPDDEGYVCSSRFYPYVPRGNTDVSLAYLHEFFRSDPGLAIMRRASPGTQVRNKVLGRAALEASMVPLPSRAEQDHVAEYLARIPAASGGSRNAQITSLSQRDFLGETTLVSNLVEPITRQERPEAATPYHMQGVRWYGEGMFTRETRVGADLPSYVYRIEPGDLVYNRLFAWKQSFALADGPGWASSEFPTFRVEADRVRPRVLLAALLSPSFTKAVNKASTGSTPTSRNRLKERDFLSLPITIPRPEHQPAIEASLLLVDRLKPLLSRADRLSAAILPAARNEIFNSIR